MDKVHTHRLLLLSLSLYLHISNVSQSYRFTHTETHNGMSVRNAWKMDNKAKGKDYIIFAKSAEVKSKWMDAFQREKDRVAQDKATGTAGSTSVGVKG